MRNKLVLPAVMMVLLCVATVTQAQSSSDTVTAQDVKKETKELVATLKQYSSSQREQAIKDAEVALEKLDGRIDDLESRVDRNWDSMSEATREQARVNLKMLRKQRNELAEWYGSFKNSSESAWEQMKSGFSGAYQELSTSWEKAKAEYDDTAN
ncbi:TPA: hypothetical protein NU929_001177 [Vibrio cholerae]|nr:hypothetical protein [Vibrio cholerae]